MVGLVACGSANIPATASGPNPASPGRAKFEVVLLGTQAGPPIEESGRTGISSALVVDGRTYLIDCGRAAVTQYKRAGLRLDSLNSIFLTHLHADHISDYYNFFLHGGYSWPDSIKKAVQVYGPGSAGGLPPKFGGGEAPTVAPDHPTPGIADLTERCHEAYAYSSNVFVRDSGIPDVRTLVNVHEIPLPDVGASYTDTAPAMQPFPVMSDDKVRVSAALVPHGPAFPAFAFRFDTHYGSATFSGDTTYTDNIITLAQGTDLLIHEAINVQGADIAPAFRSHLLTSHVEVQNVGPIAERAGAKRLVLSHIGDIAHQPIDVEQWQNWAEQGYSGRTTIAEDLQHITLA